MARSLSMAAGLAIVVMLATGCAVMAAPLVPSLGSTESILSIMDRVNNYFMTTTEPLSICGWTRGTYFAGSLWSWIER